MSSESKPDVPFCADLWSASVVVLSRRSVLLCNAQNRRFGMRLLPQPLRGLRAQISQLGVRGIRAQAAHSCKHLVARSVRSHPLRAGPAWSLSRLDRGSPCGHRQPQSELAAGPSAARSPSGQVAPTRSLHPSHPLPPQRMAVRTVLLNFRAKASPHGPRSRQWGGLEDRHRYVVKLRK
jgi:hypothetical protein